MKDKDLEDLRHHLRNGGQNIIEALRIIEKELIRMKRAIQNHNERLEENAGEDGSVSQEAQKGN